MSVNKMIMQLNNEKNGTILSIFFKNSYYLAIYNLKCI